MSRSALSGWDARMKRLNAKAFQRASYHLEEYVRAMGDIGYEFIEFDIRVVPRVKARRKHQKVDKRHSLLQFPASKGNTCPASKIR